MTNKEWKIKNLRQSWGELLLKKESLLKDIWTTEYKLNQIKEENNLHTVALLLTDIMKEGSEVLVTSDDASIFEKAFNCKLVDNKVWLDGCLSRKKQIIPFLEPAFLCMEKK